ncbi:DUF4259 domain-containing protein [Actinoplanes sp. NPDC026670]|uniref:DUF4259 domain-containing protein n=1 Tax=Actinoplanes sp. NPDC026670 TaxID=3154700 RepID=UPI0033E91BB9
MGAWGMAPFQNDRAVDLLEELGELDTVARTLRIREVFMEGINSDSDDAPLAFEVVAAAALIGIILPGGLALDRDLPEGDERLTSCIDPEDEGYATDDWRPALLRSPGPELIELAIAAVRHVTGMDSQWRDVWGGNRDRAIEEMQKVLAILEAAVR